VDTNELASKVRGIWGLLALCVSAAIAAVAFHAEIVAYCILGLALIAIIFAVVTGDHGAAQASFHQGDCPPEEPVATIPVAPVRGGPELPIPPIATDLDLVIFKHLFVDDASALAQGGELTGRYYVNLRQAALVDSQCQVLVRELARHIEASDINVKNWHVVAVPKSGNIALAVGLANHFGLAPMFVREHPLNGEYVECRERHGRALLIDDLASDASALLPAAMRVREAGFVCTHAFVLIQRTEGTMGDQLGGPETGVDPPIQLSAVSRMGDKEFGELVDRVRTS